MTIFVAGATGVLGRRVVRLLVQASHRVIGLSRSDDNDALLRDLGAESRRGDLLRAEDVARCSKGCDVILHLATAIPTKTKVTAGDWHLNDLIRRDGTAHLIAAAVQNNCSFYVQQSITFVYGQHHDAWVNEATPVSAHLPSMLRSAVDMDRLVLTARESRGLRSVILRFGTFYVHDSAQTSSMFTAIASRRFPIVGNGRAYWNLTHVDDAARAVKDAVDRSATLTAPIMNIVDNEPVRYGDLMRFIAEKLGAQAPRRIPAFAARFAIGGDIVRLLTTSARCENGLASQELGWKPMYADYRAGFSAEIARWVEALGVKTQNKVA